VCSFVEGFSYCFVTTTASQVVCFGDRTVWGGTGIKLRIALREFVICFVKASIDLVQLA
jgi:hypothetical protein